MPTSCPARVRPPRDRKSTRLNSSHSQISYAVFCLKKKNKPPAPPGAEGASRTETGAPSGAPRQMRQDGPAAWLAGVQLPARGPSAPLLMAGATSGPTDRPTRRRSRRVRQQAADPTPPTVAPSRRAAYHPAGSGGAYAPTHVHFSPLAFPCHSPFFFFNDPPPPEIYAFSLHDPLPI